MSVNVDAAIRHYEQMLRLSREAKRRRRGVCDNCGGETRYNGHGCGVSRLCAPCSAKENGRLRIGTGTKQLRLQALLADGEKRYSELREALGISSVHTGVLLNREVGAGRIERVRRGVYRLPA